MAEMSRGDQVIGGIWAGEGKQTNQLLLITITLTNKPTKQPSISISNPLNTRPFTLSSLAIKSRSNRIGFLYHSLQDKRRPVWSLEVSQMLH